MFRRRRAFGWIFAGFFASAGFQACGSSEADPNDASPGPGVAGTAGSSQNDGMVVEPPEGGGAGGESPYDPLCGITARSCNPDDATSCSPARAGGGAGGGSGSGGSSSGRGGRAGSGSGGATPAGGTSSSGGGSAVAGASGQDDGGQGGMSGGGGEGGESTPSVGGNVTAGGEAGASGANDGVPSAGGEGPTVPSAGAGAGAASGEGGQSAGSSGSSGSGGTGVVTIPRSCQVELTVKVDTDGGTKQEPRAVCAPSGEGTTGSGCFSSADCAPGLACVGAGSPGQCRPYCCAGDSACGEGDTHCTVEPLVKSSNEARPDAPVCMPATGCSLAEKYPCPDDATCTCGKDAACMVVTSDGKTSCVSDRELPSEGEGQAGQPCPCSWGHVCSAETDRCVKLCQPAAPGDTCGGTRCQFADGLPPGWGVCLITSATTD